MSAQTVSTTLTVWLQGLLWATGALSLAAAIGAFASTASFSRFDNETGVSAKAAAYDDWADIETTYDFLAGLTALVWIAELIVMIIWLNKAHKTTQRLWSGNRRWSSGWTVGGWFIPLANFIIPRKVIVEIEQIATAPRTNAQIGDNWATGPTSKSGWVWWLTVTLGIFLTFIGSGIGGDSASTASEIKSTYILEGLGRLAIGVGMASGAVYFRGLGRRLSPAGMALGR
jgi:hypothetical protein